jgi:hypothetical protein
MTLTIACKPATECTGSRGIRRYTLHQGPQALHLPFLLSLPAMAFVCIALTLRTSSSNSSFLVLERLAHFLAKIVHLCLVALHRHINLSLSGLRAFDVLAFVDELFLDQKGHGVVLHDVTDDFLRGFCCVVMTSELAFFSRAGLK